MVDIVIPSLAPESRSRGCREPVRGQCATLKLKGDPRDDSGLGSAVTSRWRLWGGSVYVSRSGFIRVSAKGTGYLAIKWGCRMQKPQADLRNKLAFLLAFSNDAVFILDEKGIITAVNDESCRLLDCEQSLLLGTSLRYWRTSTSIHPHPDASHADSLRYRALFARQSGDTFLGDMSVSTVHEGGARAYIAILRDMTWDTETTYKQNLAATVFDNSIQAIMVTDARNRIISVNPAFERLTGYRADEVIGQSPRLLQSGHQDQMFYARMWQAVLETGRWEGEIWDKRKNGEICPGWITVSVVRDDLGVVTHHVTIFHDITERKRSEQRLRHVTEIYSALSQVDQLVARKTDPYRLFDEICQTIVERGRLKAACIAIANDGSGAPTVAATFHDSALPRFKLFEDRILALAASAITAGETVVTEDLGEPPGADLGAADRAPYSAASYPFKRNGQIAGTLTVFAPEPRFFTPDIIHLVGRIAEDIAFALDSFDQERKRLAAETRAQYLARHDILTGLYRRNVIEEVMVQQHEANLPFSLGLIDLDHFKVVNDTYGHAVGDEALVHVAEILRKAVRANDWTARWGGEEFLCLLPNTSMELTLRGMERIRKRLARSAIDIAGRKLRVTASIGVASFPEDGATIAEVMAQVDTALYQAKQSGGNCTKQTGPSPSIFLIGGQIEEALATGRIQAASQPIVSLADHSVKADEALARLVLPDGRLLDAEHFIEAARHLGQLLKIDQIIIELTIQRCTQRLLTGESPILHFVNASAGLLAQADLLADLLRNAQKRVGAMVPEHDCGKPFVIEITERTMLRDRRAVQRHLVPLLDHGFRIALDHFGSGYSSLLYLADFPISFLKIEQQFVSRVAEEPRVAMIVRDMAQLGRDLGITTIAEGVETAATAETLQDLGIDWGQGHYFAMPALP